MEHHRQHEGAGQGAEVEDQAGKEFPQHQLVRAHREGEQHFPSVLLPFLGPQAHADGGQKHAQDDGQDGEEYAHVGRQDGEKRRHVQAHGEAEKDEEGDVGDGRGVVGVQLAAGNGTEVSKHGLRGPHRKRVEQ